MNRFLTLFLCILLSSSLNAQDLKGKWNFEAENAPYGYSKGRIEFITKDSKPSAKIDLAGMTYNVNLKKTSKTNYQFVFYVDGYTKSFVEIISNKGKLSGSYILYDKKSNIHFSHLQACDKKKK